MDKNHYFVVTEEKDGKRASYCMKVHGSSNLVGMFDRFITVNICGTKKEAEQIAGFWNSLAREKGNYMYDTVGGNGREGRGAAAGEPDGESHRARRETPTHQHKAPQARGPKL